MSASHLLPSAPPGAARVFFLLNDDAQFDSRLIDSAPDGIVAVDVEGRIFLANESLCRMTGYSLNELLGQRIDLLMPPALRAHHPGKVASFFRKPHARAMGEVSRLAVCRKDGSALAVDISLGHAQRQGQPCAMAFIRDVSGVRALQAQIDFQATHDRLTGLSNRWSFHEQLVQAIEHNRHTGQVLAVLLVDLDDFKAVNDGHGHAVGDEVLKAVALRLRSALPSTGTLARLGGDEFTVLLRDLADPAEAAQVARQVLTVLEQPFLVQHLSVRTGASVGVACVPQDADNADDLMRFVDMAMYQAKDNGRGVFCAYAPSMSYRLAEKLLLHERLKFALEHNQLTLHYQPQIDLPHGQVVSVEALLRWHDPELGDVSPERFIPVAESTGLMLALGDWVLDAACQQAAQWHHMGLNLRVAVNVSAQQFRQRDWVERVGFLLRHWQVPPHLLELEVTESVAMTDADQAGTMLNQLTALGVSVALDDFGMGHSSLAYLRDLPVSRLKIDRSFIRGVTHSDSDAVLAQAVMGLASTLGKTVVAEGVETPEQLDFLCQHGCETYQGWLFSKAVRAQDIPALLLRRQASAACMFTPHGHGHDHARLPA